MSQKVIVDIVVIGGGIAGLWLLTRLRQKGFNAILLETQALGCGQSNYSQGIIHGGIKYALQGILTPAAHSVADMPLLWKDCLQGKGEIDLSQVPILSKQHYLWTDSPLMGQLACLLSKMALIARVTPLSRVDYPQILQHAQFKGKVYALDEIVINVPQLIAVLAQKNIEAIFKIDPMNADHFTFTAEGQLCFMNISAGDQQAELEAKQFILAAGAGNASLIQALALPNTRMQRRPLHMVYLHFPLSNHPQPLYGHYFTFRSTRPQLTVTSHYTAQGHMVWYLGGLLAEKGVAYSQSKQIAAARQELASRFPWFDFSVAECHTLRVDRAEPYQMQHSLPETIYMQPYHNMLTLWPIKLSLAPKLAQCVIAYLQQNKCMPQAHPKTATALHSWPAPPINTPIWQQDILI